MTQDNSSQDQLQASSNDRPDGTSISAADLTSPPKVNYYGEYDENGVDLSLLKYMLQLSPLERLTAMEKHARDTLVLLEYGRRHREAKAAKNR